MNIVKAGNPADYYEDVKIRVSARLSGVKRRIYLVGTFRLLLFVAGVVFLFLFWNKPWYYMVLSSVLTFIPFFVLIKYSSRLSIQRKYYETMLETAAKELRTLEFDWSDFDRGEEFRDCEHSYSNDLDLFGEKSLFQVLNRTCTPLGKKILAKILLNPLSSKTDIEGRASAIKELSSDCDFLMDFRVTGTMNDEKLSEVESLLSWGDSKPLFFGKWIYRILPISIFIINILLLIGTLLGYVSPYFQMLFFIFCIVVGFMFSNRVTRLQAAYGKGLKSLKTYSLLLSKIENKHFDSAELERIRMMLLSDGIMASQSISKLNSLMNDLDQRNNMLMYSILNGLFLWEIVMIVRIEKWKSQNCRRFSVWLDAVAEMDAYCSMATFAFNNPDYRFPEVIESDDSFIYKACSLGHPLMRREKCVRNDISIGKRPYFIIITGANMAGKSTYLRTIGVNYLLACIGLPVCAENMIFTPVNLVTSLRTTDSLKDDESYFFAELKRLKMIIDRLKSGEKMFIILDEILKGTNSVDKQKGSLALISQLLDLDAVGIIATHDLMLGSMKDKFPENVSNKCFEADIRNNELTFSYKLREGVAQNMNACFLMNKMGIAVIE